MIGKRWLRPPPKKPQKGFGKFNSERGFRRSRVSSVDWKPHAGWCPSGSRWPASRERCRCLSNGGRITSMTKRHKLRLGLRPSPKKGAFNRAVRRTLLKTSLLTRSRLPLAAGQGFLPFHRPKDNARQRHTDSQILHRQRRSLKNRLQHWRINHHHLQPKGEGDGS